MALLRARNKDLITGREATFLTVDVAAGATTLTVDDNSGIANADLLILGEIGSDGSEIVKVNGAVTYGSALTIVGTPITYSGGCVFGHSAGTPVRRITFDQVEFYNAPTLTGTKTQLGTRATIQPDDQYTSYDDTSNTTGYGFFRFYNSISGATSTYSAGVAYTGYTAKSLHRIRDRVRFYLNDKNGKVNTYFTDSELNDAINDAQIDLAQEYRWPFLMTTRSFSAVANQREYSLDDYFWGHLNSITYDTEPLVITDEQSHNMQEWDSNTTGDPMKGFVRNKKFLPWPTRSESAGATAINDADGITATDATITVDSTSDFPAKGRIIIDSEVIRYDAKTATTFTGCTRGEEATTAAIHLNDAVVTNRDFIYTFYRKPLELTTEDAETQFEDPDLVAIEAALRLSFNRMPDDKGFMDRLQARRDRKMMLSRKSFGQYNSVGGERIKRKFEIVRDGNYWPSLDNPQNLS